MGEKIRDREIWCMLQELTLTLTLGEVCCRIWITCSSDLKMFTVELLLPTFSCNWWRAKSWFPGRVGPSPRWWPILTLDITGHLQRGHVALFRSQWRMQSPWNTCLHMGSCRSSSFISYSPKQTQHLWAFNAWLGYICVIWRKPESLFCM